MLSIWMVSKASAQYQAIENQQKAFPNTIPAGNYSGITWLGTNKYAVVSDKSDEDGFFIFEIDLDSVSGEINAAKNTGFYSSGMPNRDDEGIAYNPNANTLLISGETDNRILEYRQDGMRTLREVPIPEIYKHLKTNQGLEALSYNDKTQTLWTCNEADSIIIQSFDSLYTPLHQYKYQLDKPKRDASKAQLYAHGIGTICALDDGNLLLLEREFFIPPSKLGSTVYCKLYLFSPEKNRKSLLLDWQTSLSLFGRSLANYEGMCLGPTLADGSRALLLVADSQNQYAGVLKDWLKSVKLKPMKP